MREVELAVVDARVGVRFEVVHHKAHFADEGVQSSRIQSKINKNDRRAGTGQHDGVHRVDVGVQMVGGAARHEDVVHVLEGSVLHFTKLDLWRKASVPLSEVHVPHGFVGNQLVERNGIRDGGIVVLYV